MLLQKTGEEGGTLPPPAFSKPQWDVLYASRPTWSADNSDAKTVTINPTTISIGHDDIEADDKSSPSSLGHEFGWDNESPKRSAEITSAVRLETRPILNAEYYDWWSKQVGAALPAQWVKDPNGGIQVCLPFSHSSSRYTH